MASQVPELFDPVKLHHAFARTDRLGYERFLLDHACQDLIERLAHVKRNFTAILDFATPLSAFAAAFAQRPPENVHSPAIIRTWQAFPTTSDTAPGLPPLDPETHDLILSGMHFHHVNDLPGLMLRMRRALKPDGLMMASFPGGDTLHELRDVLLCAEAELRGGAAMRILPMIDVRTAGMLLQRAGFALPVADSEKLVVRYSSLGTLIADLRAMASTAAFLQRPGTPPLTRAVIGRAAELYGQRYADRDGKIRVTFEFVWMSGWAPHESQQKPLQPGSAKEKLGDALARIRKNTLG